MIEFKNVYKTYPNGFTALKNISLQIEQGEFVAIIGLSGAGKSTLRCINRMHDITKGELTVDGVDVDSLRGKELRRYRRKVGMIFQSFNLVSRSTAIKNVLTADVPDMPFFKVLLGIFSKEQKMRALESLDKVGILDKALYPLRPAVRRTAAARSACAHAEPEPQDNPCGRACGLP